MSIMSEVHDKRHSLDQPHEKPTYADGVFLSRFLYWHIGVMGFDSLILHVFHPEQNVKGRRAPTMEEIYPDSMSCLLEWNATGVLHWESHVIHDVVGYGSAIDKWMNEVRYRGVQGV